MTSPLQSKVKIGLVEVRLLGDAHTLLPITSYKRTKINTDHEFTTEMLSCNMCLIIISQIRNHFLCLQIKR